MAWGPTLEPRRVASADADSIRESRGVRVGPCRGNGRSTDVLADETDMAIQQRSLDQQSRTATGGIKHGSIRGRAGHTRQAGGDDRMNRSPDILAPIEKAGVLHEAGPNRETGSGCVRPKDQLDVVV